MGDGRDQPSAYPVGSDDTEMRAAMERARATFGEFLSELEADSRRMIPALSIALVKGRFSDEKPEDVEYIWVDVEEWDADSVTGSLSSRPEKVKSIRLGDTVRVPRERLSDWLYVSGGIARGAFTVQVLRRRMSAAQRREHDSHYPFSFDET
jgi:uncharacterized protein YegJ (DUF2314 family)